MPLRLEHEFTHYATKRLYGKMTLNVLDELIADWAGMSKAMGHFRAAWFVRFLGLDGHPTVRSGGRIHAYRGTLSDPAFRVLGAPALRAASGLEALHEAHYSVAIRERFFYWHSPNSHYNSWLLAAASSSLERHMNGQPECFRPVASTNDENWQSGCSLAVM